MAQIDFVQPALPSSTPATNSSPASESPASSSFAPHLENAIAGQQQSAGKAADTAQSNQDETTTSAVNQDASSSIAEAAEESRQDTGSIQYTTAAYLLLQALLGNMGYAAPVDNNENKDPQTASGSDTISGAAQLLGEFAGNNQSSASQIVPLVQNAASTATDGKATAQQSEQLPPQSTQPQSYSATVLDQLQKIIDNSSETGTVSISTKTQPQTSIQLDPTSFITANAGSDSTQLTNTLSETGSTQNSAQALSGSVSMAGDKQPVDIEKLNDELEPVRKNSEQQYYSVKLSLNKDQTADDTPSQDQTAKDSSGDTTNSSGTQSTFSTPATSQHNGIFSATIAAQMDIPTNTVTTTTPTMTTVPSGTTTITDSQILQQINEHLQVLSKPTETQLNIRLHPAELGELKIDITVKDGSIKAHVVAQSQQVQEIIEKNMNKLRTVLEDNGFTIDEISVANQSDSITDFNLFDEQFAQNNDSTPGSGNSGTQMNPVFQLDEILETAASSSPSVNLTI